MHSTKYFLDQLYRKLSEVQHTLLHCRNEEETLEQSIDLLKRNVEQSLNQHMETLQRRANWLSSHAECIYQLKDNTIKQQIVELEIAEAKLNECLQSSTDLNCDEHRETLKNALKFMDNVSLHAVETGSLTFKADNEMLEEMIINFGRVDVQADVPSYPEEYDTLSDDDEILVCKPQLVQQKSIEMQVKSIEMMPMAIESVDSARKSRDIELKDFKIEEDYSCWVIGEERSIDQVEQQDDEEEEGEKLRGEKNFVNWLASPNYSLEPTVEYVTVTMDDVSSWIISCRADEKNKQDGSATASLIFERSDNPLSQWIIPAKDEPKQSVNEMACSRVPPVTAQLNNFTQEELDSSDSTLWLHPVEKCDYRKYRTTDDAFLENREFVSAGVTDHMNSIMTADNTSYLHAFKMSLSNDQHSLKPTSNLDHMDKIMRQSNSAFLIDRDESQLVDPSLCDWLIGKSKIRCEECNETCNAEKTFGKGWLKTASEW